MENFKSGASSDLLPSQLRPDMYSNGGEYNTDNLFDGDQYSLKQAGRLDMIDKFYDHMNYDLIKKDCASHWNDTYIPMMNEIIQKHIPSFVASKKDDVIRCPLYYNYEGDRINFDYEINIHEVINYFNTNLKNSEDFQKHLDTYQSRSGFISFAPSSLKELETEANDKEDIALWIILDYILLNDQETINDYVIDNPISNHVGGINSYMPKKFHKRHKDFNSIIC